MAKLITVMTIDPFATDRRQALAFVAGAWPLESLQAYVGGLIQSAPLEERWEEKNFTLYVNEEGLLLNPTRFFCLPGFTLNDESCPLAGRGIVLKYDDEGDAVGLSTQDVAELKACVQAEFFSLIGA